MKLPSPYLTTSLRIRIIELFSYENIKIMLETNYSENPTVFNKFERIAFLNIVQRHPFVFFVKNNTLTANTVLNNELSIYATKIHYAEHIDLLTCIFKNFSPNDLDNVFLNCILIETEHEYRKIEVLNTVCFLEKFLKTNQTSHFNQAGKLNYKELENKFCLIFKENEYKKLMKKPGKYFFQSLFGLNVHKNSKKEK